MIYWDNAATTWPKPMAVTEAMSRALTRYGANPGRGGYEAALQAAETAAGKRRRNFSIWTIRAKWCLP